MRHIYAYRAVYTITTLLVLASLFFAWIRSQQLVIVAENEVREIEFRNVTTLADFEWQALGEEGYRTNCASCHGAEGRGWDAYPPLTGQGLTFAAPGGRSYLIQVTLYGLASDRATAPMPFLYNLSDAEVAAINNYMLTNWGNEERLPDDSELYIPSDVAQERGKGLSPWDVNERRP